MTRPLAAILALGTVWLCRPGTSTAAQFPECTRPAPRLQRAAVPVAVDLAPHARVLGTRIAALAAAAGLHASEDGGFGFGAPDEVTTAAFAQTLAGEIKAVAEQAWPEFDAWDAELVLPLDGENRLLRVVIGRDGAGAMRDGSGEDGVSLLDVTETRPGVLLVAAGGHGGAGRGLAPGGAGGSVFLDFASEKGVAIALGGDAGRPGAGRAGTATGAAAAGPGVKGKGPDGKPGGDAMT